MHPTSFGVYSRFPKGFFDLGDATIPVLTVTVNAPNPTRIHLTVTVAAAELTIGHFPSRNRRGRIHRRGIFQLGVGRSYEVPRREYPTPHIGAEG